MTKLFILVLCAILSLIVPAMATTTQAIQGNSVDIVSLLENGGQSMAFLVAMYWLKDSHQRRVEDAQEYAKEMKEIKQAHREEIQRLQDLQKQELIHSQNQLAEITSKLFAWIRESNEP